MDDVTDVPDVTDAPRKRKKRLGYHVRQKANGKWQGRAWDPHENAEVAMTFATEAAAVKWAKAEHARLQNQITQAGTRPIDTLIADYIADKRRTCSSTEHVNEIERVLRLAAAAGVTDMRSPRVAAQATTFLLNVRASHRRERAIGDSVEDDDADDEAPHATLAASTLNGMLDKLRAFGNWCVRRNHILRNPFIVLDSLPEPDFLKATFRLDELATLIDPTRIGHEYFLAFASKAYLGLRQGEAANIDWSWMLWQERMVRITWSAGWKLKRQKERLVPMPDEYVELLRAHAKLRGLLKDIEGDDPITKLKGPLNPQLVKITRKSRQQRFNAYLEHCGVAVGDRTPHSARHTWISLMLATGEPESLVQLYAGHDKLETTSEYARSMVQYRRAVSSWPRGELHLRLVPDGGNSPRKLVVESGGRR